MATSPATLTFVPWVRQGVATAIDTPDSLGAAQNAVVDISVTLSVNGQAAPAMPVRLRGPADVLGIDASQIIRTDPRPGSTDFEPTYFPCVEFDRPDYPWLFTPAAADGASKLRPWMCLVVVRKQDGVTLGPLPDAPLPVLQISSPAKPGNELPDLVDCWAWAHAQAASPDSNAGTVKATLNGPVDASLSRLVCPRVLAPDTDYIACVVPTFELGRRTGVGTPVVDADLTMPTAATPLAPAWKTSQTIVKIPVYYSWEFRTGPGGDFQSLASSLRPEPMPRLLGRRPVDISAPGFRTSAPLPADATVNVEGALQPAGRGNTAEPWDPQIAQNFQEGLLPIVNAPAANIIKNADADPLVAPPLYGSWHAQRNTVLQGGAPWFDELNLDPRLRTVAAFGTKVVQDHQEALMASAWEQAAELQTANQRMRRLQLALAVNESLHARHINQLSDEGTLRVIAPAFARLRNPAGNVIAQMSQATLPVQAVGGAMRRIGRQRGPMTRRIFSQHASRSPDNSWVARLSFGTTNTPPAPHALDLGADWAVSPLVGVRAYSSVTAAAVSAEPKKPFWIYPEGQLPAAWPYAPFDNPAWPNDDAPAADFRRAAIEHLTAVDPARVGPHHFGQHFVAQAMPADIKAMAQPRPAFKAMAAAAMSLAPNAAPALPTTIPTVGVESIMVAPRFPQPMYEPLRDVSQELLLPGLDTIPPDRVVGLETNRRFVESFMVGLNVEMGRELLWRGFPTDQRGTYFDQFWGVAGSSKPRADIVPLDTWGTRVLGSSQNAPQREQFVLLLRSALLRRYPNALVCLTPAVSVSDVRQPSPLESAEVFPVFSGSMQPDVSFFGFDLTTADVLTGNGGLGYYLIIQEHPTEPRFGLSVAAPNGTIYVKATAPVPTGQSLNGLQWGLNAAQTAGITRRLPVRLAIHTSLLIASA